MSDLIERLKGALTGRYAVERELGRGGMAVVFLAADLRHERKVAIKILRPELTSAVAAERFLREIRITAGLAHPHILPLLDSGEADGLVYFVMPYVEGESLRHRLEREGQLPVDEALQITQEVADALSHAHSKDVLHRDIKPENILIEAGHAIVADFGIAKALSEAGGDRLTDTGISVGTAIYMSPEQIAGDPSVDARSDIYSLACVAYELLAGEPPYTGDRREVVAQKMLGQVRPLRELRPEVVPGLEAILQKALEAAAEDRFSTADEFTEAVESAGGRVTYRRLPWLQRTRMARRIRVGSLAAVVILAATVGYWFFVLRDSDSSLVRERIVVLPFENKTGDQAHDELGSLAAEWIAAGLGNAGLFEVVPMHIVNQRLEENLPGDRVRDLADYSESGTLVTGSFYLRGDSIEFHAELLDAQTESPSLLHTVQPVKGAADDPMAAIETVKEQAAGALAARFETRWGEPMPELYSPPPSLETYREELKGIELYERTDWAGASVHFYRAIELDSTYLGPIVLLVGCHFNMGEFATADSLLRILEAQRARLTPYEQVNLDSWRANLDGDAEAQYRADKEMQRLNPFDLYRAAWSAMHVNRPREAAEILSTRDFRARIESQWAPWWAVHVHALHQLGRHEEELEVAREGRNAHPDYSYFVLLEARTLVALGRLDELEVLLAEIAREPPKGGNNPGLTMTRIAVALQAHGHEDAAAVLLERTLAFYESPLLKEHAGDPPAVWYRSQLAQTLYHAGRYAEALPLVESLQTPESWQVWGRLGLIHARLGEREKALEYSDRLGAVEIEYLYGAPTVLQARIAAVLGERGRAVNLLLQAFDSGAHYGWGWPIYSFTWIHRDESFWSLRDYEPFQELVRPKG